MIALSIVYVAAENFFERDIGRRWILTFCFGLIHGFGFASALRECGIPQGKVGWALGAFSRRGSRSVGDRSDRFHRAAGCGCMEPAS